MKKIIAIAVGALLASGTGAALAQSKREYLRQYERRPSAGWAAYQLYIR